LGKAVKKNADHWDGNPPAAGSGGTEQKKLLKKRIFTGFFACQGVALLL